MKVYIETMGCAMNSRDSEHLLSELSKLDYKETNDPKMADLILINTCSVREKPERKLFSEIGQFAKIKKPNAKIGVCGCTASHMGADILKKAPSVSFVLGARNVSKISQVIHKEKAVEVAIDYDESAYAFEFFEKKAQIRSLLNISIGCDKKCTYCIVPHTRGKEISIPMDLILKEAEKLANNGTKELMLLGQNVNNYGVRFSGEHAKVDFSDLLDKLSEIQGIERIRFTSPHPLHMNDAFLERFAKNPKVCKSIHMPLQSGSSAVLKMMRRGYSKEWFLNRVERLKALVPEVGISTDIIVGFPNESDKDFEDTMEVLEKVRFDTLYSFIYSPRPFTEAGAWKERVPLEVSSSRLERLQNRHKEILEEKAKLEVGKTHVVLVENRREMDDQIVGFEGRSDTGKFIEVTCKEKRNPGELVKVEIISHSKGRLIAAIKGN